MEDSKQIVVIGDVHGCYNTLLKLLELLPKEAPIFFVGDMIDRGKYSKEVIDLVLRTPRMASVMGNHEQMMVNYTETDVDAYEWVGYNGGQETILSYDDGSGVCEIPDSHYDFTRNLPLTITKGNVHISHSHANKYQTLEAAIENKDILWNRGSIKKVKGIFQVFGHTPHREPVVTKYYANVDTGCVFGGKLTAIELPSKKIYQVNQVEEDKNRWYGVDF